MSLVKIDKNNFNEIKNGDKPVLIDFYATWCGPCRMVAPIIEEIASERGDIAVGKVNVDESPELAAEFGVYSIPTLVVLKGGKVHRQVAGARPKDAILSLLD
ncbi:MAG: thioredoxin [Clostridia bacterium]|nr:thioredoxin [Clostridia bacterium]